LVLCIGPNYFSAEWVQGGVNSATFQAFLSQLPHDATFALDNASIHKAGQALVRQGLPSIQSSAAALGQRLAYLPPYSPQLNPVELCFNIIKARVRRLAVRDVETLKMVTHDVLSTVNAQRLFRHCWTRA
jgi:transposase